MQPAPRYEIIDQIAAGDFATVYRARDRDLGREVAVKQIHQQFLADPRQLARYWQEAQLLASLQHPNIVTIYDIDRPRGWLILELMRGSLKQSAQGEPLDLDYLRRVLVDCLNALQFLHSNGVIHGDVKPSNILVGPQQRLKLGDFGLARRASNEEGSLLRGTTKYMAPELLSPQFGAIGPASDLYSLGFSAYELMCGQQFESLLPGLATFGRDKQIAWMMWHAAADLKLPEIPRVMEGVPDDLAHVIQKLIVKDQSRRYQSAGDVLRDLRPGPAVDVTEGPDAATEAALAAEAKRKRRLRYAAVAALAFSAVLSLVMLIPRKEKPAIKPETPPDTGVVLHIRPDDYELDLKIKKADKPGGEVKESVTRIKAKRNDRVFINEKADTFDQIKPDDYLEIVQQGNLREFHAYRPLIHKGHIESLKPDERRLVLAIDEGDEQGKKQTISVPSDLRILLNGKSAEQGRRITLADLKPGDRLVVCHVGEEHGRRAVEQLTAEREVTTKGRLADDYDLKTKLLSIDIGSPGKPDVVKLPFAPQFLIAINGQPAIKPTSLKKDDRVTVRHDTRILDVKAERDTQYAGTIKSVVYDAPQQIGVQGDDGQPRTFSVGPLCEITLGGERAAVTDLRADDKVRVTYAAVEGKGQEAISATAVEATRPPDDKRWAILIATQNYDDRSLTKLSNPVADAKLLADALVRRYKVPATQAVTLFDASRVGLEQGIPEWLKKVDAEGRLVVYVAGHAYRDDKGQIVLAPQNFDLKQATVTGLPLKWLVDQIEQCPARDKLLLLDCCADGEGLDLQREPSTAEMLRSLRDERSGRLPLRTTTAIASCQEGQRGQLQPGGKDGLFAAAVATAYEGQADTNRDARLEPGRELFAYLQKSMAAAGSKQAPELFLPNEKPDRLSPEAKDAIRRLAAFLPQDKPNLELATRHFTMARKLAPKEPDAGLLLGLVLMKGRDHALALRLFSELQTQQPELLLPMRATVWIRFEKQTYRAGFDALGELVSKIPKPKKPGEAYSLEAQHVFYWAGQLREYAAGAVPEAARPSVEALTALDNAIAAHGAAAEDFYQKGREQSLAVLHDFDKRISLAENGGDAGQAMLLKTDRRQLRHYVRFPYEKSAKQILDGLDL